MRLSPTTQFLLQMAPGSSGDTLQAQRLIVIKHGDKTLELLAKTASDAQGWISAFQRARETSSMRNVTQNPLINQDGTSMQKNELLNKSYISKRRFMEITVNKQEGVPLGLRLAGGVGPGSDPNRPYIYVYWTLKQSPSAIADLRKGDIISHVNRRQFKNLTVDEATEIISSITGPMHFGVERLRSEPSERQPHHDEEPPQQQKKQQEKEQGKKENQKKKAIPERGSRINSSIVSGSYGFGTSEGKQESDNEEEVFGFDMKSDVEEEEQSNSNNNNNNNHNNYQSNNNSSTPRPASRNSESENPAKKKSRTSVDSSNSEHPSSPGVATTPTTPMKEEPQKKEQVAEDTPKPAAQASSSPTAEATNKSPEDDARAARLAKMRAAREMRKQTSLVELDQILSIIDNLEE